MCVKFVCANKKKSPYFPWRLDLVPCVFFSSYWIKAVSASSSAWCAAEWKKVLDPNQLGSVLLLDLLGSLPLSGTQKVTGGPLRGKMAAEGKNRAHALTAERYFSAERHTYGLGPNFSVIYE
ncbi:hypothetical protein LR48_Vigan06g090700 [Vigna angularis]|uniref:Uncharacterized protein n=1 Tax=Phaseolus angularis TaxID=3914 RepID=A0A0L9USA3_PHAAN|nr:hypothetical protein LR48_Vigan06g090700 [Vigna angularis]